MLGPITVFMHARRNPAGAERLLWCDFEAAQDAHSLMSHRYAISTQRVLRARLIAPGSATEPPDVLATVETEFDQHGSQFAEVKLSDDGGSVATTTTPRSSGCWPASRTRRTLRAARSRTS